MPTYDITEDVPIDLAVTSTEATFNLTDIAYDIVIDDLPFIVAVNNQNPYRRETAPYKKDQFDNSPEPGEQSLTGWWLRSQTSWHNGSGISFYEPGTDLEHVTHRFADSRGIDVWTIGEATLLPDVFHAYTGAAGINAATGNNAGTDVLVSGDANGVLKRITLNDNSAATTANYVHTATSYPQGHSGSDFPFTSVTTSGGKYYATCTGAIHRGTVGTLDSDVVFARHSATTNAFVKYAKGFIFFGENHVLNLLDDSQGNTNAHSGALPAGKQYDSRTHLDSTFVWNDIAGGQTHIYASGNAGNSGEIVIGAGKAGKGTNTAYISGGDGPSYNGANTTTWATISDRRLKKNIVDNNIGLEKLTQIQVRNFEYRLLEEVTELPQDQAVQKQGVQLGVIAQELQAVLPDCVTTQSTGVLSVDTDNFIWYAINAIKELKAENNSLKARLDAANL